MERWIGILVAVLVGISLVAGLPPVSAEAADKPAAAEAGKVKLNLNTATAEQLSALPGVGEVTARAIVDFRGVNGPFKSAEDLVQVKGIGEKKVEAIRPLVAIE